MHDAIFHFEIFKKIHEFLKRYETCNFHYLSDLIKKHDQTK